MKHNSLMVSRAGTRPSFSDSGMTETFVPVRIGGEKDRVVAVILTPAQAETEKHNESIRNRTIMITTCAVRVGTLQRIPHQDAVTMCECHRILSGLNEYVSPRNPLAIMSMSGERLSVYFTFFTDAKAPTRM